MAPWKRVSASIALVARVNMRFAASAAIDRANNGSPCFVYLSSSSVELFLDALSSYLEPFTRTDVIDQDTEQAAIDAALREIMAPVTPIPIGVISAYGGTWGSGTPDGWLECAGQTVAIADYPDLYAVIGVTYGAPAEMPQNHFNLPNLTGRLVEGTALNGTLGVAQGSTQASLTANNLPQHTHPYATFTTSTPGGAVSGTGRYITGTTTGTTGNNTTQAFPFSVKNPTLTLRYLIKAK